MRIQTQRCILHSRDGCKQLRRAPPPLQCLGFTILTTTHPAAAAHPVAASEKALKAQQKVQDTRRLSCNPFITLLLLQLALHLWQDPWRLVEALICLPSTAHLKRDRQTARGRSGQHPMQQEEGLARATMQAVSAATMTTDKAACLVRAPSSLSVSHLAKIRRRGGLQMRRGGLQRRREEPGNI